MIQIKNRFTGAVIYQSEGASLREAVVAAVWDGANLRDANLRDANLRDANLRDADLEGANLRGADLADADLAGANLRNADLRRASLRYANLEGANLAGADLRGANLEDANLEDANLEDANLEGADLEGAYLRDADLEDANLEGANLGDIPTIPSIDAAILDAIAQDGASLDMGEWHSCETTHCRAGWAVHLAGDAGCALEQRVGPATAGALIYAASGSHPVPDFYCTNQAAIADMRKRAGRD